MNLTQVPNQSILETLKENDDLYTIAKEALTCKCCKYCRKIKAQNNAAIPESIFACARKISEEFRKHKDAEEESFYLGSCDEELKSSFCESFSSRTKVGEIYLPKDDPGRLLFCRGELTIFSRKNRPIAKLTPTLEKPVLLSDIDKFYPAAGTILHKQKNSPHIDTYESVAPFKSIWIHTKHEENKNDVGLAK